MCGTFSNNLIACHIMTNRKWVAPCWLSSMAFAWTSSHNQQEVSDTQVMFWQTVLSHLTDSEWLWCDLFTPDLIIVILWPIGGEWYQCSLFGQAISSHPIQWPKGCEWHWGTFTASWITYYALMIHSWWGHYNVLWHMVRLHQMVTPMTNRK